MKTEDSEHAATIPATESGGSAIANSHLFLKTDYRVVKVNIPDIRYIEGMSEYLKVWVEGEAKPIITLLSIPELPEYELLG